MISKRGLNCVSYRLPRNKSIGESLDETHSVSTDRIGLLLSAAPEGPPENADNKVCVLQLQTVTHFHNIIIQDYIVWCAVGKRNRIARVDIRGCDVDFILLRAVEEQSGYMDLTGSSLWKVRTSTLTIAWK